MVKRAGREVVTVEVFKETYESFKKKAEQRNDTTKEFINELLINILSKLEYLKKEASELSVDSYEGNRVTLRDGRLRRLIDVYEKGQELFCEQDKRTDCIHSKYVWTSPEVDLCHILSLLKHPTNDSKNEFDKQLTATVNHQPAPPSRKK